MSRGIVAGRIESTLRKALTPLSLEVMDESARHAGHAHVVSRAGSARSVGETHFRIKVVSEGFRGKTRLERHRTINALLADELTPDGVHALAIEARAPGE